MANGARAKKVFKKMENKMETLENELNGLLVEKCGVTQENNESYIVYDTPVIDGVKYIKFDDCDNNCDSAYCLYSDLSKITEDIKQINIDLVNDPDKKASWQKVWDVIVSFGVPETD
jgi:hypothetical protein